MRGEIQNGLQIKTDSPRKQNNMLHTLLPIHQQWHDIFLPLIFYLKLANVRASTVSFTLSVINVAKENYT